MCPVETLACGHAALTGSRRVCRHLLAEEPPTYVGLLTGVGVDYDAACESCADDPGRELLRLCEGCVERATAFYDMTGWRGTPEVRVRDRPAGGRWAELSFSLAPRNGQCVASVDDGWAMLADERLILFDGSGSVVADHGLSIAPEPPSDWVGRVRCPALHASVDGRFAVVVTDYGRFGQVVDLSTGGHTLVLDRGDYHNYVTPFPVCFVGTWPDTVVVAATAWNRLDAFDAATGRLLTARETGRRTRGQPIPDTYLDYFHGRLLANPSGRRIVDDGWVWHPAGIPTVIDVAAWLAGRVYAPENGRRLAQRNYAWDQPMAWLDDRTVAIQRIGPDDELMLDGVQRFDVETGRVTTAFAGPSGRMWAYRGRLYVGADNGTEIWDPASGSRIALLEGLKPIAQSPHTGTLVEANRGALRTWTPTD